MSRPTLSVRSARTIVAVLVGLTLLLGSATATALSSHPRHQSGGRHAAASHTWHRHGAHSKHRRGTARHHRTTAKQRAATQRTTHLRPARKSTSPTPTPTPTP